MRFARSAEKALTKESSISDFNKYKNIVNKIHEILIIFINEKIYITWLFDALILASSIFILASLSASIFNASIFNASIFILVSACILSVIKDFISSDDNPAAFKLSTNDFISTSIFKGASLTELE